MLVWQNAPSESFSSIFAPYFQSSKTNHMKKLITLFVAMLAAYSLFAQSPQKMTYQAVIRNISNSPITNAPVKMRISILQGSASGTAVYSELHNPTTNANGLATIEIGSGTSTVGSIASINWGSGTYFLKTETDPTNSTNYSIVGTSQLLSVPYSLHSGNGVKSISDNGDTLYLSNGKKFFRANGSGNLVMPTVTTNPVTAITSNSANLGGTISNANDNQIMERGVVYSTTPSPTFLSKKIIIGSGTGTYDSTSSLSYALLPGDYPHLLKPNTIYYVRAYVLTENNISVYGNEVSFTTLPIGQTGLGGGVVFFDKGNTTGGWRYLEAAPNDQSTGIEWGCNTTSIPGTQLAVGSGKSNTSLIVASCNQASFAAKLCDNLTFGGQSDWFLPSRDEINLMYQNLYLDGRGNFSSFFRYWSSTEYGANLAWPFSTASLTGSDYLKTNKYPVRAVRAY